MEVEQRVEACSEALAAEALAEALALVALALASVAS